MRLAVRKRPFFPAWVVFSPNLPRRALHGAPVRQQWAFWWALDPGTWAQVRWVLASKGRICPQTAYGNWPSRLARI